MNQLTKYLKTLINSIIGKSHKDIDGLLDYIDDLHEELGFIAHRLDVSEKLLSDVRKPAKKAAVKKAVSKKTSGK